MPWVSLSPAVIATDWDSLDPANLRPWRPLRLCRGCLCQLPPGSSDRRRYCSEACRRRYRRARDVDEVDEIYTCAMCGVIFTATRNRARK
jgi:hypothetical protein